MGLEVTWTQVNGRRLERQGLGPIPLPGDPAAVVTAMCGAHAQVLSAGELSVGLRSDGLSQADVRRALWEERSLVKTFGPRGTVHLLPTADLPLWTGALSAMPATASPFKPEVRMSGSQTDEVVAAVEDALADAELTVDELTDAIVARVGSWAGDLVMPAFQGMWPRWRQVMATVAHRGALCFGPNRGRKVTYTSPRRWCPDLVPADGDRAPYELLERYLRAYGPSTPQYFAKWLNAPQSWVSGLFSSSGGGLAEVLLDGTPAWVLADDAEFGDAGSDLPDLRLLPYFDAFAIASQPRERLFPGSSYERALARGQAGNYPVLLVDGVAGGVWHQRRSGRRLHVTVEPLGRLAARHRRALEREVARVGDFFGADAELTIGPVTAGPHA